MRPSGKVCDRAQLAWPCQLLQERLLSIQSILNRISAGEQLAFAELVALYQRPLFGFLGRIGMGQAQAEDIAQETFLRAWVHLPSYQPERAQFGTWLFTIARNLAYNAMQSAPHQRELPDAAIPEQVCEQPGPAQAMERAQQSARLQSALRQLPMAERSALALVYVHELGLADVARIEGDSVAAIKTRLHRAKHRLREILQSANESETTHE
jgi:RNA polymerase sigma-70 factor (ECF subfamily)